MPIQILSPTRVVGAGNKQKLIDEFAGLASTACEGVSIARMSAPPGWFEPAQAPGFDEYTIVTAGALQVEARDRLFIARAGDVVLAPKGEWVRYSTTEKEGAAYFAVCLPAFSLDLARREER